MELEGLKSKLVQVCGWVFLAVLCVFIVSGLINMQSSKATRVNKVTRI